MIILLCIIAARQHHDAASDISAVSCPRRGVHHTSPTDGCIHRLTVGCHKDHIIGIDHSCSAPGQTGNLNNTRTHDFCYTGPFLLLVRYVPDVAKTKTWQHCIYWWPTTDRPTSHFGKFWTAISRQWIIRSSSCLASESARIEMSLLPIGPNSRSRPSAVLYNFEWPYLWNGSSGPIRIWF